MILIEVLVPEMNKKLYTRVCPDITIGELAGKMGRIFRMKSPAITILGINKKISEELTLDDIGIKNGAGVLVTNGRI